MVKFCKFTTYTTAWLVRATKERSCSNMHSQDEMLEEFLKVIGVTSSQALGRRTDTAANPFAHQLQWNVVVYESKNYLLILD